MEDHRTYSLSVLKLAWLQGHDTIVCLPTGHDKSPIFKCILHVLNKGLQKEGRRTNIFSPDCISALSLINEQVSNFCKHSLSAVHF